MGFQSKNLSYMFNKEYYSRITDENGIALKEEEVKTVNGEFISCAVALEERDWDLETQNVYMRVCYPGLVAGIGYPHDSASADGTGIEGIIALGFSFDYVTGIPYIPGSSVKGALRSVFQSGNGIFIRKFLGEECDAARVKALEEEIFEGVVDGEELPSSRRDIFFDAYPSTYTEKNEKGWNLMALDAITPHVKEGDAEKLNPLTLLKVKPDVIFCFRFSLKDGSISAAKKLALFKKLLICFGAGAKTNVGYGAFTEYKEKVKKEAVKKEAVKEPAKAPEAEEEPDSLQAYMARMGGVNIRERGKKKGRK